MQGLIPLALYAATLLGMLYGAVQAPEQSYVFAAGTGHEGLACSVCHHVHAPVGVRGQWESPTAEIPRFPFYGVGYDMLDESSRLCFSCHDGAIAPAVHMPPEQPIVNQLGLSIESTGGSLRMGGHPVGVRYNPLQNRRLVREPGLRAGVEIRLPEGRVQCISCHDPHGTTGHEDLLWVSNRRSELCLTCHQL